MRVPFSTDLFKFIYSKSQSANYLNVKAQMNEDDKEIIMDDNHEMMTTQLLDTEK